MASKKKVKEEVYRGKFVESQQFKHLSVKRVFKSFKYSFDGLVYAYTHEQSLSLHIVVMALIVLSGILLKISPLEWLISIIMGAVVLVIELLNTSIEAVVDLVTEEYHPLAKIAKDTASAAEFVACIIAFVLWLVVFLPKIIALF